MLIYFSFNLFTGNRFAKMQIKSALHAILTRFKIDKCEKTCTTIKPDRNTFIFNAEGGVFVRFTKREK